MKTKQGVDMKTITVELTYDFVRWILEDFSSSDIIEHIRGGTASIEDLAISVMGDYVYLNHINNWEEIKPKLNESYYDAKNWEFVSKGKGVLFGNWCEENEEFAPFSKTDKYKIIYVITNEVEND
jgi:hypothetical protein